MAKGKKARHDAAVVVLHIERAKEWGRIVGTCVHHGWTESQAAVAYELALNRALVAQSFLTPGAYAMAFAKGYREGFPNDIDAGRRG